MCGPRKGKIFYDTKENTELNSCKCWLERTVVSEKLSEDDLSLVEESRLEVSRVRVFQSDLKTGGGATQIVHMTSSRRSHEDKAKDGQVDETGCMRPCYAYFVVFIVLDSRIILLFCLSL
jgi:hypothetical protein